MSEGFLILDAEQRVLQLNASAERILGVSLEAAVGKKLEDFLPHCLQWFEYFRGSDEGERSLFIRDLSWKNRLGQNYVTDFSVSPLLDAARKTRGWLILIRDVSRLQQLEEEKRQGERLAMMGTIAAGLAHEIKNPLGGIKGGAQLLSRQIKDPRQQECLEIIIKETDRVNTLISSLLTFSKPRKMAKKPVNINQILDTVLKLQEQKEKFHHIRIKKAFDPSLPKIEGDPEQLTQAFLNLIKNAMEAMSGGGDLTVGNKILMGYKIHGVKNQKWQMIEISVQDTGGGMAKTEQESLFTPFFTTKKSGTGLGLSITQQIIHEHKGMIKYKSQKGKGTTFQVYLPVGRKRK